MKLGVLCSGGKDSIFSCGMAKEREEVACLITVQSENEESYLFHTPNVRLVRLQAEAMELPLVETGTTGRKEEELEDLGRALDIAVECYGIEGVVTGAILSVYQATRIQRLCQERSLWCFNPLWHTDQEAYLRGLCDQGYDVLVSGVFSAPFEESWLGRRIDASAIEDLKQFAALYRITLTGEGGEYETFVADAPFFFRRIEIVTASKEYANYRGIYRITGARLVKK
jgi:ABC transporter with metal-binding/Fe-S-binding domain ATP-binding protein